MRLALLCLLLSGCWSQEMRVRDCMFGAATDAQAEQCVLANFGEAGVKEMRRRQMLCDVVATDFAWRAVNCPQDKDNFPKAEEPRQRTDRSHSSNQEG